MNFAGILPKVRLCQIKRTSVNKCQPRLVYHYRDESHIRPIDRAMNEALRPVLGLRIQTIIRGLGPG